MWYKNDAGTKKEALSTEFPLTSITITPTVNTLTLDVYRAMLNTGSLGGEGVPFICIVSCSIVEKRTWEWYFEKITKEERFFSSHVGHSVKDNSTKSASFFFYFHLKKRE
jgi:hypothetical protein